MIIDSTNYITELKNENTDALNYVVKTYGNLVFKIAYKYINHREGAEECLNDVLMKVWTNATSFSYPDDKFKNWICAIAKNTAIDIVRRECKLKDTVLIDDMVEGKSPTLDDIVISKENYKDFILKLNNLKDIDREIIIQRFYLKKSLKDIGNMFNLDHKTVFTKISRAREKLK